MINKINYFVFKKGQSGENLEACGELHLFETYSEIHNINWDNLSRTFNSCAESEEKFKNSILYAVRVESGIFNDGDYFDVSTNHAYEIIGYSYTQ